jgi:hypothetical protein
MGLAAQGWMMALAVPPQMLASLKGPGLMSVLSEKVSPEQQGVLQGSVMSLRVLSKVRVYVCVCGGVVGIDTHVHMDSWVLIFTYIYTHNTMQAIGGPIFGAVLAFAMSEKVRCLHPCLHTHATQSNTLNTISQQQPHLHTGLHGPGRVGHRPPLPRGRRLRLRREPHGLARLQGYARAAAGRHGGRGGRRVSCGGIERGSS